MADDLCGRTLGGFVLGEKLAEGGCGDLYCCSQPLLKREAVIKVLRETRRGDKEAEQRFLREGQLASSLDHHFAAHIYDAGVHQENGLRWIAMERIRGVTLDQWLVKHGRMSLEQLVPLLECIAQVVQHAHEREIVHRDLKPANVMVIERDGRLIPKLLDFGIAKMLHEIAPDAVAGSEATDTDPELKDRLTPVRGGFGSSAYMSPEQWRDAHTVGPGADIYALGVLAYKALAGRVPFTAEDRRQ